jgi:hypothetical protein
LKASTVERWGVIATPPIAAPVVPQTVRLLDIGAKTNNSVGFVESRVGVCEAVARQ